MEDGYIEDFQIYASSETKFNPGRKGRLGDVGWCSKETREDEYTLFQVRNFAE